MRKAILSIATLITLAISGELILALAAGSHPSGYAALSRVPARVQSAYIDFMLQARFGYFRNCARKTAMFRTIEINENQLQFERSLLIPYLNGDVSEPIGADCPLLVEPAPQIAFRVLSRHNRGEFLLIAVREFRANTGSAPTYCSKVPSEQSIEADVAQLIELECQD